MASGDEIESLGYAGYMWEPEYSEGELFERFSDTDDCGDIGHARSAHLTWCTCSFCASMDSFFFVFVFALCPNQQLWSLRDGHTFSWTRLNKRLTSTLCTCFRNPS